MKMKNLLPKLMAILLLIIGLASCEEDFNNLGSEIIGDQNINAELDDSRSIIAYSRKLLPVQTNSLPVYQLGIYNDPVYGKSTVNLLAQVTLEETSPSFGDNPELESVILYIPFFSKAVVENETTTYTLDSIYGDSPINIAIYESEYFLRDFDPDTGFEEPQNYYANQGPLFENFLGELIHTIEDFKPSDEEIIVTPDDPETPDVNEEETLEPGLRVELPLEFFKKKIIDMEGTSELINNSNFREYFRGIYFKVSSATDQGNLFLFDLEEANITLNYTFESGTASDDDTGGSNDPLEGALQLLFNAISVNVYQNNLNPSIAEAIANPNTTEGEANLYVRGGDGIISVIELFGPDLDEDGVADELEDLREKKWLINEANLIFYVDKTQVVGGDTEPERLIIYDIKNSTVLFDYFRDITASQEPVNAINEHLGRLQRGSDGNGNYYKIKLTNHISNLINKDSTNVPLGLIVSHNVLETDFQDIENIQSPGIEALPATSIVSPQGTILYGNTAADESKRLKLQIYYTEPN